MKCNTENDMTCCVVKTFLRKAHYSVDTSNAVTCFISLHYKFNMPKMTTVVPATTGPFGERSPASAGHFCNVPTTVFAVLMSLYRAATCHEGPLSLRTGGDRSWQVLLYNRSGL